MNKHEHQLRDYLDLQAEMIENKAIDLGYLDKPLRYNRNRIVVSDLEDEYFCEAFLDCSYTPTDITVLPEIEQKETKEIITKMDRAADLGTKEHLIKEQKSKHIEEQIVRGIYKDILIAGQSDEIQFDGHLITVIDHKFKTNIPQRDPYDNHKTQALAYAYCIHDMVLTHPEYSKASYELIINYASTVNDDTRAYSFPYSHQQILKELDFVYPFWKMQRNPIATKNRNKCNTCEYKFTCSYSPFYTPTHPIKG